MFHSIGPSEPAKERKGRNMPLIALPNAPGTGYMVARLTSAWKICSGISLAPSMPSLASIPTG